VRGRGWGVWAWLGEEEWDVHCQECSSGSLPVQAPFPGACTPGCRQPSLPHTPPSHFPPPQVIRGLIAAQPPRAKTQAAIDAESAAIAALEAERRRHEAALEQKRRAFALLLQCIDDLQRSGGGDDDGGGGGGTGGGGGPVAMQVDG
jgi:hypothetical protein